jgi:hypothetical protein
MKRDWKPEPGDMIVGEGGVPFLVVVSDPLRAIDEDGNDWYVNTIDGARPLVVIDPEDREQVKEIARLSALPIAWTALRDALREFASPTPPKPDEPQGLGAVVEDDSGLRWTRVEPAEQFSHNPWYPALDIEVQPQEYRNIDVVRVLSEGVSS